MRLAGCTPDLRPLVACLGLVVAACQSGPPLSVDRIGPESSRRALSSNALSGSDLSASTRIVLRRRDLASRYQSTPEESIAALHATIASGEGGSDELFALAELSFANADRLQRQVRARVERRTARRHWGALSAPPQERPEDEALRERARMHHLASALYAFAFLFSEEEGKRVPLIDPRGRIAADFYNYALAEAFRDPHGFIAIAAGTYRVPFGDVTVTFDESELHWGSRVLFDFLPANEFEVRGLINRYRRPGIGAPLTARTASRYASDPASKFVSEHAVVTATAVLLFERPREQLASSHVDTRLQLFTGTDVRPVGVDGRTLPLEVEPSAALAASLEESGVWENALMTFLGRTARLDADNRLFAWEPRLEKQIPVVLVHGTNSTPAVWANMVNDLQADPRIRRRYQFLFYAYESGSPILYSSMVLRRSLREAVEAIDPKQQDICLREMVVIGHSQGGLLAKSTAIRSGDRFWQAISSIPFQAMRFTPRTRELLQEAVFVEPLPFVERVVFIATPHRGSFLASSDLVRRLAARLIRLPAEVADVTIELAGARESLETELKARRMATSIDNMSPSNEIIQAFADIPVVDAVVAHSIIPVAGDGALAEADDGVVRYTSAYIPEAASTLVVNDGHSTQSNPHTVEEVRRILLLHEAESRCVR